MEIVWFFTEDKVSKIHYWWAERRFEEISHFASFEMTRLHNKKLKFKSSFDIFHIFTKN